MDARGYRAMNTRPRDLAIILMIACFALPSCGQSDRTSVSDETKTVVAGNNAFALDLYGQLKASSGNLFFSPYGISACLAMTYGGAQGDTEKQIARVLHFGTNQVKAAFRELQGCLNEAAVRRGIEIHTANGLWAQSGHPLLPAFLDIARQQYGAE